MNIRLAKFLIISILTLMLASCNEVPSSLPTELTVTETTSTASLNECIDKGQEYIDSLIFIGESTTYHLKSRGVLKDGENTKQIWAPECGTVNLDMGTKNLKILYPETNEFITYAEAANRSKPKCIIFTFGLNGAVGNIKRGKDYYKSCYLTLINSIRETSPDTKIILQSGFPIAENMDMTHYTVSAEELNSYIDTINSWTLELASDNGFLFLQTSDVLKDDKGFLRMEFQVGDGHHLTTEAYQEILMYIRTH